MNRFKRAERDRGFDGTSLPTATITIHPPLAAAERGCFVLQTPPGRRVVS